MYQCAMKWTCGLIPASPNAEHSARKVFYICENKPKLKYAYEYGCL